MASLTVPELRKWLDESKKNGYLPRDGRVALVLERLGNPHINLPAIHVAGTNGKGTTCAYLSNLLQLSGHNVGLFTSPHLCKVEERIRINADIISVNEFNLLLLDIQKASEFPEEIKLSFYEITFIH